MKIKEFKEMTDQELVNALNSKKSELFNLRFSHATGNLSNPLSLKSCKRDIARIKTLQRQRQLKQED